MKYLIIIALILSSGSIMAKEIDYTRWSGKKLVKNFVKSYEKQQTHRSPKKRTFYAKQFVDISKEMTINRRMSKKDIEKIHREIMAGKGAWGRYLQRVARNIVEQRNQMDRQPDNSISCTSRQRGSGTVITNCN